MDIVLCGKCGWLGSSAETELTSVNPMNEALAGIIESNGLVCKCCPKCNSTSLYYRSVAPFQFGIIGPNEGSWLNAPHARHGGSVIVPHATEEDETEEDETGTPRYNRPVVSERPESIPAPDLKPLVEPDVTLAAIADTVKEEDSDAELTGEEIELTSDVVSGVLAEAEGIGGIEEEVEEVVTPPPPERPKPRLMNLNCDVCGEDFGSKINTSRCPACYKKLQKQFGSG